MKFKILAISLLLAACTSNAPLGPDELAAQLRTEMISHPGSLTVEVDETSYLDVLAVLGQEQRSRALESAYQLAVENWPDSRRAVTMLANFHFNMGDLEIAAELLRDLTRRYPNFAPAHNNLAVILMDLELYREAVQHADVAVALSQNGPMEETYIQIRELALQGLAIAE